MNQQFYIAVNGQQTGPFTLDELRQKGIQRDTLIWTEGLDNWTKAEHVALLREVLRSVPPPIPTIDTKSTTVNQPVPPIPVTGTLPTGKYFGYELATRRERLVALLVGSVIIAVPLVIIDYIIFSGRDFGDFNPARIFFNIVIDMALAAIFYSLWSGNLGHKIMGLKVISSKDGSDFTMPLNGAIREGLKSIFSFLFIPIVWLLWDDDRQNLYDKVVKSYVVKKKLTL